MENMLSLALAALVALILIKLLLKPMKWIFRAAIHGLSGVTCLWLVNSAAVFTGFAMPVNGVTVLLAGTLGIPGLAVVALLEML